MPLTVFMLLSCVCWWHYYHRKHLHICSCYHQQTRSHLLC
jgi:hypothetical protein